MGRGGSATLAWRWWRWWWWEDGDNEGGEFLSLPQLMSFFFASTAAVTATAVDEGVKEPGPKNPAAAGVPGESGAVAVASTGQTLASEVDTVRETRRLPSAAAGASSGLVTALIVLVAASLAVVMVEVSLGIQQRWMHVSQTRFGAV